MISAFVKLLFACAQATPTEMDIVGELPVEVSSTIFRYLDAESLVKAAAVNHHWNSVCKSDAVLRKRIHKRLRQERKARIEAYMKPSKSVKIVRQANVPAVQFAVRNENISTAKLAVKYEAPKTMKNKPQVKTFTVTLNAPKRKCTNFNVNNKTKSLRL